MTAVAVATPSRLCTDAAAAAVAGGGNAVDAALAAIAVAMISEPGVCAPGGGIFITVGGAGLDPVVYDGYMEMPGRGLASRRGVVREVTTDYGGGTTTLVGPGTIATPGAWAAMGEAWAGHGRIPWSTLLEPAIDVARGFPLPAAAHSYLEYTHEVIFGADPASYAALHRDGILLAPGGLVVVPGLEESMRRLADEGPGDLYTGELAHRISTDILRRGGILTLDDLTEYRTEIRPALTHDAPGWRLATNPPPAVGGAALVAMIALLTERGDRSPATIAEIQREVLDYRRRHLGPDGDRSRGLDGLLAARHGALRSPSTVHVSAVDERGMGCAVTASAGYGSGVIPAGTGFWMNNALGEIELVGDDPFATPPGTRLLSNMAPTLLLGEDGEVVAAGSPGADRITTALMMVLGDIVFSGESVAHAVARPRLHVEFTATGPRVAHEPGIDPAAFTLPVRSFPDRHMFFGGVGVAALHADGRLEAVADPRRAGDARVIC